MMTERVLAIDPGKDKCGLAVVDRFQGVLARSVVKTEELPAVIERCLQQNDIGVVVLGDRTRSAAVRGHLEGLRENGRLEEIVLVDEHNSSQEGRNRYWESNPPRGWRRIFPKTLLTPPCAWDDFAAIILAERFFAKDVNNR